MHLVLVALSLTLIAADSAPKAEPLWSKAAPGALGDKDADVPTLTPFLPATDKGSGAAVVICPGGGYGGLAISYEGMDVGAWMAKRGVAGFVLKYRVAPYKHPVPLEDVQRALRTVRSHAKEWNLDPARIGILGFSAGGHLASTAATHFDDGKAEAADPIDRASCRPDFAVLCYPVVTLKPPYTHMGSRINLLGEDADEKLVENLSNDLQVTAKTPPTFLFHTADDNAVPVENSLLFFEALHKAKIPAELHVYEHGRHGVGLAPNDPALSSWPDLLEKWMKGRGLIKKD